MGAFLSQNWITPLLPGVENVYPNFDVIQYDPQMEYEE